MISNQQMIGALGLLAVLWLGACRDVPPTNEPVQNHTDLVRLDTLGRFGGVSAGDSQVWQTLRGVALSTKPLRLLVGDGARQRIVVLDSTGALQRSLGREGSGPGESKALRGLAPQSDGSVCAWDSQLRRITHFGPAGDVLQTGTIDLSHVRSISVDYVGFTEGCTLVVADRQVIDGAHLAITEDSLRFLAFESTGRFRGTTAVARDGGQMWYRSGNSKTQFRPLFGARLLATVSGEDLWYGHTSLLRWNIVSVSTGNSMTVRLDEAERHVSEDDAELRREERIALGPELLKLIKGPASLVRELEEHHRAGNMAVPVNATLPAFDRLVPVEGGGGVWFRSTPAPGDVECEWRLIAGGRHLAVPLPCEAEIEASAERWIAVSDRDEFDVPRITLATLRLPLDAGGGR